jgi:hypothetical protein
MSSFFSWSAEESLLPLDDTASEDTGGTTQNRRLVENAPADCTRIKKTRTRLLRGLVILLRTKLLRTLTSLPSIISSKSVQLLNPGLVHADFTKILYDAVVRFSEDFFWAELGLDDQRYILTTEHHNPKTEFLIKNEPTC